MSTPALEVSGLKKRFGGLPATRDVSLSVMPGERRLIIGPNGAGKTTLFNVIAGDLDARCRLGAAVRPRAAGRIPTQRRVHLGLARTYQILTLFPKETLCHNVVLALLGLDPMRWNVWTLLSGKRHLYDAAREALTLVGLGASADRTVAETSYGERRRLEMAMALAQKPEGAPGSDEPLARGCSQEERQQVRDLLGRVPRDVTIVMIEHEDMDLAASPSRSASRCCIMAKSSSKGPARKSWPIRAPRRCTLASEALHASVPSTPTMATAMCCTASALRSRPAACSGCSAATAPARPPAWRPSWASSSPGAARSRCSERKSQGSRRRRSREKSICLEGRRAGASSARFTVRENSRRQQRQTRVLSASRPWTLDRVFELFPRLKERHAQLAGSLSGGEQQMLAIGRALMGNPRVLLMDEPSEGLAPQIVAEVGRTIAQLKADGLSIVLVEQNIKLTLELADDVVIVNTGAVVFSGTAAETRADEKRIAQHLGVF